MAEADNVKRAVIVASFGTSYSETREAAIGAVERAVGEAFPCRAVRRAFTSRMVIEKLRRRDGIETDTVAEALEKLAAEGFSEAAVQPTHVISGYEYEKIIKDAEPFRDRFISLSYGAPLLSSDEDYERTVKALAAEIPEMSEPDTAVVFVGHGTEHPANAAYAEFGRRLAELGYGNCFTGTVEARPGMDDVLKEVTEYGASRVVLYPLMTVAGDHAVNDICGGGEGSWLTAFSGRGFDVTGVKKGLGEYAGVRRIFTEHVRAAIAEAERSRR